jgi:hypothetical protein
MTSTTQLHAWYSTVHFPSLQPVSKTYYCTEQMLSWEAVSWSRNSIYFMKSEGSLPWIISHLQGHSPSSLYKMIIITFLKELASKTFWIFFLYRGSGKSHQWSDIIIHVKPLSELTCYSSLPYFLRSILISYSYLLLSLPELLCCIGYEVYLFKFF